MSDINLETLYLNYQDSERNQLLQLKDLILEVAEELNIPLDVSLKWQQLSFSAKSGTPIRIDRFSEGKIALFVHCQTTLVEEWREMFQDSLTFSKTRAIVLEADKPLPVADLKICIQMALIYKIKKK